jgi:hypothetical protein
MGGNSQTLPSGGAGNITISNTGSITIGSGLTINGGNFNITNSGSLTIASTITVNSGGSFLMNTSGTVNIGSGNNVLTVSGSGATATLNAGTLNINGPVLCNTSGTLTIAGATVNIPTGGTVSKSGNSIFQIVSTGTFNFSSGSVNVRSANGNTTLPDINIASNSGTITGGTFSVSNATITVSVVPTVYNFTVDNNGGTAVARLVTNSLSVSNNFTLTSGTFDAATNSLNTTIGGTLTLTAGTFSMAAGTLTLNGPAISVAAGTLSTTSATNLTFGGSDAGPLNIPSSVTALNNLTLNNTNGTPATLNVNASTLALSGNLAYTSGTIDMGTNILSTITGTISGTGTVKTANTSVSPLPSGKTWTGLVNYTATTGNQTIVQATYNNLQVDNSINTNSAGGNLVVNGTLTTTANGILDMTNAYTLTGTLSTITNNGTILTAVPTATSATPLAASKTWGGTGTVWYNGTGAQTVVAGNYNNLNLTAASSGDRTLSGTIGIASVFTPSTTGVHTVTGTTINFNGSGNQNIPAFSFNSLSASTGGTKTATGNISIASTFTIASRVVVDMATFAITGATLTTSGTSGSLKIQNTSSTPLPSGRTWAFSVEYNNANGAQTIMGGTYTTALVISNTNNTTSTGMNVLSNVVSTTVNGTLTLNTNANLALNAATLTLGSSSTISGSGTLSGAGAASSVAGANNGGTVNVTGFGQDIAAINFSTASTQASTLSNLNIGRIGSTITIGSCTSNTLTISGSIALNAGTLNDGGKTISVGGGSFVTTTNTSNGGAIHTGTGTLRYTRTNGNLTSGAGTFLSLGNVIMAGSGTQTMATTGATVTLTGALSFSTTNNIALGGNTLIIASTGSADVGNNQLTGSGTLTINGGFKTTNSSGIVGSVPTASVSLGASSSVEFASASAQTIDARVDYNNLNTSGGSTKSLAGNITVAGTLKIGSAGDKLSIGGNTLTLNGTVDGTGNGFITGSSTSNISVGGTGSVGTIMIDQGTDGTTNLLNNFTLNRTSAGAATLGNKLVISNVYTPTAGVLTTGGFLHLRSNSTNTARIAQGSSSGGYISGNITVERYLSANDNRAYRLLTSGVSTTTSINANWQEGQVNTAWGVNQPSPIAGYGTHITGTGGSANGFDVTLTNAASLNTYDPTSGGAWVPVTNTNVNTLDAKTGYLLFIRGNRDNANTLTTTTGSSDAILRATGTTLQGTQTFTNLAAAGNFSLVTNPYASPIDWETLYTHNSSNFENAVTVWSPNGGGRGSFVTIQNDGTVTGASGTNLSTILQSGQAFFVQTKAGVVGNPTLTVQETHKATTSNLDVFRAGNQTEQLNIQLKFLNNGTNFNADGVLAVFNNNYSNAVDSDDAEQIANWDEDVALGRNGKSLSIEKRMLADNDTLFLQINNVTKTSATYRWEVEPSNFNTPGLTAYLVDKFTGITSALSLSSVTVVSFTVTNDPLSKDQDRFYIVLKQTGALPALFSKVSAQEISNKQVQVQWQMLQETSLSHYIIQHSTDAVSFKTITQVAAQNQAIASYSFVHTNPVLANNYYKVIAVDKNGQQKSSSIVSVSLGSSTNSSFAIYPNPVQGDVLRYSLNKYQRAFTQLGCLMQKVIR